MKPASAARWTVVAIVALATAAPVGAQDRRAPDRRRPPDAVECPRDRLTSYTGRVTAYTPAADRTALRIRTDWNTTERIEIRHPGEPDASKFYLIDGEPFSAAAWASVEVRPGMLASGVRATAWVCEDGRVVVEWKTPRE